MSSMRTPPLPLARVGANIQFEIQRRPSSPTVDLPALYGDDSQRK